MEEKKEMYKFAFVVNLFDKVPDFLYPVFTKNKKYYIQEHNNKNITSFKEITNPNFLNKKINFKFGNTVGFNFKTEYSIGDEPLYSFQLNTQQIFLGNLKSFIKVLKSSFAVNETTLFPLLSFTLSALFFFCWTLLS